MKNLGGGRGLYQHANLTCTNGSSVRVTDSSSVKPRIWLSITDWPKDRGSVDVSSHLTPVQARRLAKALVSAANHIERMRQ